MFKKYGTNFLMISNLVTLVLWFHALEQWKISNKIASMWQSREEGRVAIMRALLPFYMNGKAHSVDISKLLSSSNIDYFHKDGTIVSGPLEIELDNKGNAIKVNVEEYHDKTF